MQAEPEAKPQSAIEQTFSRFWAFGLLLLVATSWRLWFPVPDSSYPLIPLVPLSNSLATGIRLTGIIASVFLVVALLPCIVCVKWSRSWCIIAASLLLCFLSDQHRIQPWAYQSFFYAILFGTLPTSKWRGWILPIIVSIYAYSALGKFDSQFFHTVGDDLIRFCVNVLPMDASTIPPSYRYVLVAMLPFSELMVALFLCFRRMQITGSCAAICMHLTLIAIFGPWAKNHSLGLLIWNLMLVSQHLYLISSWRARQQLTGSQQNLPMIARDLATIVRFCLWTIAIAAPAFERTGYWDHWTSWSLYSPHTSRARIEIHQSALNTLSASQRSALLIDDDGDQWQEINLGEWSLLERGVPVYPQARYQLELAYCIAEQSNLTQEMRVKLQSVSDRKTGKREEQRLLNLEEISSARSQFWLHSE